MEAAGSEPTLRPILLRVRCMQGGQRLRREMEGRYSRQIPKLRRIEHYGIFLLGMLSTLLLLVPSTSLLDPPVAWYLIKAWLRNISTPTHLLYRDWATQETDAKRIQKRTRSPD
jgi:hypothetical protein